jgi:hypothetical protein
MLGRMFVAEKATMTSLVRSNASAITSLAMVSNQDFLGCVFRSLWLDPVVVAPSLDPMAVRTAIWCIFGSGPFLANPRPAWRKLQARKISTEPAREGACDSTRMVWDYRSWVHDDAFVQLSLSRVWMWMDMVGENYALFQVERPRGREITAVFVYSALAAPASKQCATRIAINSSFMLPVHGLGIGKQDVVEVSCVSWVDRWGVADGEPGNWVHLLSAHRGRCTKREGTPATSLTLFQRRRWQKLLTILNTNMLF